MTNPSRAFDGSAPGYDVDFTHTASGQWLRARVWERLAQFQAGMRVLEIGCGTGEDAVWLAQRGVQVVATDASPAMLEQTWHKADSADVASHITLQTLDLNALPNPAALGEFDGAYSNFGALNCTANWGGVAELLGQVVKPQGKVMLGVMSPFCLWETLWHGVHLDFRTATRRWRGKNTTVLADGATLDVFYPSVRRLKYDFAPYFTATYLQGVGVALPPSDVYGVIEKYPALQRGLMALENPLAHLPIVRTWADHYWLELERQ